MMGCRDCQDLLADYLSDSLARAKQEEFDQHLALCPACRLELAAERGLDQVLSTRSHAQPPPDFTRRILARLQQEKTPAPAVSYLVPLLAYAASLVAIGFGLARQARALSRLAGLLLGKLQAGRGVIWDRAMAVLAEGNQQVNSLLKEASEGVSGPLLQRPELSVAAALAILLWALYISLAEEDY